MATFNITTTGLNISLEDIGVDLTHPQTVNLFDQGLGFTDILDSQDLQDALEAGTLTATDGSGNPIGSISFSEIAARLDQAELDIANKINSIVAGTNVTVDNTDPLNPIINAAGGGGGSLVWMQVNNTNVSTNINTSTSQSYTTTIPISGAVQTGSDTSDFTKTTNGIQCNFDGVVLAFSNVDMFASGARVNIQSRLRLNGTPFGSVGSSGYIRNSSGHNESSVHSMGLIQVTNGQEITVGARRESTSTTSTILNATGTSNLILIKFS